MPDESTSVGVSNAPPDIGIMGNQVTIQHAGFSERPQDEKITEQHLVHNMVRFRERPLDFLREVSLYLSGTGWRAYDDVIGQPIFYPGYSDHIKSVILQNPLLQNVVRDLAERRIAVEEKEGLLALRKGTIEERAEGRRREIEGNLHQVVDTMMDNMICKMNHKRFIRGAYYLTTRLLTRAYHHGKLYFGHRFHFPVERRWAEI